MATNQIKVDELEFDLVKSNLKKYLSSQEYFTDYNFEGSTLSAILDLLSYHTLYNGYYNHLAVNEMFIDSASKYSSVVSLAKTIGYIPKSIRSSRAKLNIRITDVLENPSTLTIPRGTTFRAMVNDRELEFYTLTDMTAVNDFGVFFYEGLEVIEGTFLSKNYTVTPNLKFVVPNEGVDTSTIQVVVQEAATSSIHTKFNLADNILKVQAEDPVYFLKLREDLLYEVYFGNGVIGKALRNNNVVKLEYIISSGASSNGARNFVYSAGFRSDISYDIETVAPAFGGEEREDIESIKFNAPRAYVAQNRAVTDDDYDQMLRSQFPVIESLSIWGGQHNVPPVYGKVFIAAKPSNREFFTEPEKTAMKTFLIAGKNINTIIPEMVDPEFLRVQFTTNVYYNKTKARRTNGEMTTLVRQAIQQYGDSLSQYGSSFRFSQLTSKIDNVDSSIISNISTLKLRKAVDPIYNITAKYTVRFENPIYQDLDTGETVWSTRFYIGPEEDRCFFKDDGAGNIDLYLENTLGETRFYKTVGTVDYSSGTIQIVDVLIRGLYDNELEFMCTPLSNDVIPIRQYIVTIPPELMTVNLIADDATAGNIKQIHKFSSSR